MQGNGSSSGASTTVLVRQLQRGQVRMLNTSLTCEGSVAVGGGNPIVHIPAISLLAETAQQLMLGIQLLGQLQPATIVLVRDMQVPADGSWPKGLVVNMSLVLTGLPPPAPPTLLDLYQVSRETLNPKTRNPSWTYDLYQESWLLRWAAEVARFGFRFRFVQPLSDSQGPKGTSNSTQQYTSTWPQTSR